jgi:pilus assembly protein CpaB
MDAKKIILLVVALIVAGGTAFMARALFLKNATPPVVAAAMPVKKNEGPEILVAIRALPVGTIIEADSFRYQPWPDDLIESAYFLKGDADPSSLAGTVVRSPVTAGQPLTKGALVKPGEHGFLAAALGPGMRAISIPVPPQMGSTGFVFPGDRVDLVLTQKVEGGQGPALNASETFVRNIRVLAVDQRMASEDEEGKREPQAYTTVTLEATPRIAEKIAVAQSIGQISLSLRSLAENAAELERAIASGEVKVPANGDAKAEHSMMIKIAARPTDSNPTLVTGADVSRFQRRTVPKTPGAEGYSAPTPSYGGNSGGRNAYSSDGPVVKIRRGSIKDPEVVSVGSK